MAVPRNRAVGMQFLSTLPARGATLGAAEVARLCKISIHAPREGSDPRPIQGPVPVLNFYPRSPRGERPDAATRPRRHKRFLSTLPARGATDCVLNISSA